MAARRPASREDRASWLISSKETRKRAKASQGKKKKPNKKGRKGGKPK